VKGLREFEIPFVGLKIGVHEFDYAIDGKFFSFFEGSPIADCNVKVKVEFEKKETFFILKFFIDGSVKAECDRCLISFDKEIFGDYVCYIKFTEDPKLMSDEDEVIYISRDETILDISQLVYEYIILCLPMQRLGCVTPGQEPQCNKEVLKYLVAEQPENENESDPRWEALKKFKKD
jgi:uncharacterized metal-binding protein YceD (DUF177 family)